MSGPPKDIPAADLWAKLQARPRPSKLIDFPGAEGLGQFAIWVLTQEERMSSITAAEKKAKLHLKDGKRDDIGYESLYSDALCIEILSRACRDSEDLTRPLFPSPKLLQEKLTTEELAVLFQQYLTVQLELGPIISQLTEAEMNAWVERLVEGGSAFPFEVLTWETQRILLLFMARQVASLRTASTSAGSLPEDPPTPDETDSSKTDSSESE